MRKFFRWTGRLLLGLVCGIGLRLWQPMSESVWLGGQAIDQPLAPVLGTQANSSPQTLPPSVARVQGNFLQEMAAANPDNIRAQAEQALAEIIQMRPYQDYAHLKIALARWVELDLAAAHSWWLALPAVHRQATSADFFAAWMRQDPAAGRMAIQDYTDQQKSIFQPSEITALIETDPAAALEMAVHLPLGPARLKAMERALIAMADLDPLAAFGKLTALAEHQDVTSLLSAMTGRLASGDLARATEILRTLPEGLRGKSFDTLAQEVTAKQSYADSVAWIRTLSPGLEQSRVLAAYTNQTSFASVEAMFAGGRNFSGFIAEALNQDPQMTLAWQKQLQAMEPKAAAQITLMSNLIFKHLHETDPAGALSWAQQQPDGTFSPITESVLAQAKSNGPDFLMKMGLPSGVSWTEEYAMRKLLAGPQGLAMASKIGGAAAARLCVDGRGREERRDPHFLQTVRDLPDDEFRATAAARIARGMAESDAASALEFANLAMVHAPDKDFYDMARSLCLGAPKETSEWLTSLPPGPRRDGVITNLAPVVLSDGDPAAAFQWSLSLSDPARQLPLAAPAFAAWSLADPAAAQAALESENVSTALRNALQSFLPP